MTSKIRTTHLSSIEVALDETPREEWPTSPLVSRALLSCRRLTGIIANLIRKRAVNPKFHADIQSEVALIMQMKMIANLDEPAHVYFVAFRVAQLVIYNWGKKEENTYFSPEINMSECGNGEEGDQEMMDKFNLVNGFINDGKESEQQLDRRLARDRLAKKIEKLGWPKGVTRERARIGRPTKVTDLARAVSKRKLPAPQVATTLAKKPRAGGDVLGKAKTTGPARPV